MKRDRTETASPAKARHDDDQDRDAQALDGPVSCPVVGIGASAGGLEALIDLFKAMPADCGMAFLVVMHLDPTRESALAEVLSQHCALTVSEAADGEAIKANHIYVIPPAASLTLDDGHLRISEPLERRGTRFPVDRLFESLARGRQAQAVCIVLSGSGSDGTEGLKEVKEQGGCVLVQDPVTARFDAMPRSVIAANLADHILPPRGIPFVLCSGYGSEPRDEAVIRNALRLTKPFNLDSLRTMMEKAFSEGPRR